jgi:Fur family ferric uptake transcriptional regulator
MSKKLETAKEKLSEKDHKITPQREAILKIFLKNLDQHLSAEDVYLLVKKDFPEIGLATVYRTLELFRGVGILHELNFGDGKSRYEFVHQEEQHHHHHLICMNCGRVIEVDDDLLETLEERIEEKYHFNIVNHQVKFYGLCGLCKSEDEGK